MGINGDQTNNSVPNSGAVYVFHRSGSTWTQEAYLKASNTGADDDFGYTVALDGDTLAVGANGEASNATGINGDQTNNSVPNSGAVYVFHRAGSTWTQEAYLKASNTGAQDAFGGSVALSGDTLAVGAIYEGSNATGINGDQTDNTASSSGAVYVFHRAGSTWTQEAYLKASNTGAGDHFGYAVALSSDTLAVGARYEDSSGINGEQSSNGRPNSGAVYVFRRAGSNWTQEAFLKASYPDDHDRFGSAVALDGDTLAVGAELESSGSVGINGNQVDDFLPQSGAVYVFSRAGFAWTQNAYLKASNPDAYDNFGWSVALSGDTLAVGSRNEASNATGINGNQTNNAASSSGAVYVRKIAP
jgi:hypothetical protein